MPICSGHTIQLMFKLKRDSDRLPKMKKMLDNPDQSCKKEIKQYIECVESNSRKCEKYYQNFIYCVKNT